MNETLKKHCREEIHDLENKNLISKSRSPWSFTAFYVNKNSEIERGSPKLVINYKPLNSALKWIRYPILNKKDLLQKLHSALIFLKFDIKLRIPIPSKPFITNIYSWVSQTLFNLIKILS